MAKIIFETGFGEPREYTTTWHLADKIEDIVKAVTVPCECCGYKNHSERIKRLHDCTDCSNRIGCNMFPKDGNERINCFHWR